MKEQLNNPISGSGKEQPASGTELDEKGKKEKLLAGKFKSQEELVKAYQELEVARTQDRQESALVKERIAKLEGKIEVQEGLRVAKSPVVTPEERKKMEGQFKTDFNENPLQALYSFNRPFIENIASLGDELREVRDENTALRGRERKRELKTLANEARNEDPEKFDELKDSIEKELREDENLSKYENPYMVAFYKVLGKSYKKLAKGTDAERKSFVEGASPVPPKEKKDKKSEYKKRILEAGDDTRL